MPGKSCAPDDAGERYENVHVGVQRKKDPEKLVAGDEKSPAWTFAIDVRPPVDGAPDFGGPYVHGRRGERFLYLTWGTVDGEVFAMFRRAKLVFADCPDEVLTDALDQGGLHIRVRMRDRAEQPPLRPRPRRRVAGLHHRLTPVTSRVCAGSRPSMDPDNAQTHEGAESSEAVDDGAGRTRSIFTSVAPSIRRAKS